jgi:hypothetical protein
MKEMKKFYIDGHEFDYQGPKSVIEGLCRMQWISYSYIEFFEVLKKRLSMWNGDERILQYDEQAIVDLLLELNEVIIE